MQPAFSEIAAEFERRISSIIWATVSSVNPRGQTRVRVLHPVWEDLHAPGGPVGWIGTSRTSSLARHIKANSHVSVAYLQVTHEPWLTEQVYADCTAIWADSPEERARVWDLMASLPPPYGFDPAASWQSPENQAFGFLRLEPWRIEVTSLGEEAGWSQAIVRADR